MIAVLFPIRQKYTSILFPDKKPREVKKILTALVDDQTMEYWSSGSTTMYGLKGAGKQSHAEGED